MKVIDYLYKVIKSEIEFIPFSEPQKNDNKVYPNEIMDIIKKYGNNFMLNGQEIDIDLGYNDFGGLINRGIEISNDGAGNSWVIEVSPNQECKAVYFCCHDPAILLKQSNSLIEFFQQIIEDELFLIEEELVIPIKEIDTNLLNEFSLDDKSKLKEKVLVDLSSNMKVGQGFDWDKFGPRTTIIKHKSKEMWLLLK
ncbi:hypothetical protein KMW28_23985 [Flammeovirga yaeyamensis]|uniref:SMI1/KNR4 family protein n=1 Tax=Flammeovirga yaeyamensis TaxID=367791 RepID=A0AAX1NG40_9BACT|nr:hypothetical protein [Flammeovirga yaeyamensis]MBB3696560.1 hypothetical protein [Flammeovirga yaeyamensis]NMF33238.1 hypothetical protein [Flammeovirga yaeyamensis]QWG05483.1 hypothetical protein KMW28_23985 [Flammeovirga yaeyamensis]